MDYSKYIQMKMEAANTYRSNWRARDASEVTARNQTLAQRENNASQHHGPVLTCPTGNTKPPAVQPPGNGFSTDFSQDTVTQKPAGCANCNDVNWGSAGGVTLKSCAEVSTILALPANPIKRTEPIWGQTGTPAEYCVPCADSGVYAGARALQISTNAVKASPAYSGWRNHVPVTGTGVLPLQVPSLPS